MAYTKEKRQDDSSLEEMRRRYELTSTFYRDSYARSLEDVEFVTVPGNQWDQKLRARRNNRPCYEFPKLRSHVIQVQNEMRQSRPQGKVRGTEDSDRGLAEIMQGICRNIEAVSNAERAYDIAFEFAVQGGFGDWKICTDYLKEDDFEQDIRIEPVRNPFASKPDPAAVKIDRSDARFWFLEDTVPRSDFERDYPEASITDFDGDGHCNQFWRDKDSVRVCEYWYKMPRTRKLLALSDGRVVFADKIATDAGLEESEAADFLAAAGIGVVKEREVESHTVCMRLTNGHEWLTPVYKFPSKYIPIVRIWGNLQNINGDDYWSGLVRFSKDQQRLHNLHRTALIEAIAKAPKAPYALTASQIKGYETMWKSANAEDYPYLLFNPDSQNPGPPQRTNQTEVPVALITAAGMDNDDIKAATGQYDASLGQRSNETSGKAINSRKQQGATATFNFIDNLAYGVRYTYEILGDMIPNVIDTPRAVRILGEDGGEKWKQLYQEVVDPNTGQTVVVNDISKGKYDYTVTVGASYATQRMEAAEAFANLAGQIGGSAPAIGPLLAYAAMQNQDLPGMEESLTAFRKVLVAQGLLEPKEGEQAPQQQQQPNPKDLADAKKAEAQSGLYAAQAEGQELQNAQLAAQMGAAGLALPGPDGMQPQQMQMPTDPQGQMGGNPQFTGF